MIWKIVAVIVGYIVFLRLYVIVHDARSSKDAKEAEHVFSFPKRNDFAGKWLGDSITRFLDDYEMGEDYFKQVIVAPAVRSEMDEYRKEHPKPKA